MGFMSVVKGIGFGGRAVSLCAGPQGEESATRLRLSPYIIIRAGPKERNKLIRRCRIFFLCKIPMPGRNFFLVLLACQLFGEVLFRTTEDPFGRKDFYP
jgi:hypothetical protein